MSSVLETINTRSSIRKYSDRPLTENIIRTLIEAGLQAPTATNRQEIHISYVSSRNPVLKEIQNDLNPDAETSFWYDAPAVFFLSGEDAFKWSPVDAGIAVQNMHLTAKELGFGSVILGCMRDVLNGEKKAEYAEKLGFPEGYTFQIAIAAGYPDTEKAPHTIDFKKNAKLL